MYKLIVVNNPDTWDFQISGVNVVSARDYLTNPDYAHLPNARVFNLCKDYSYQSRGYYVSLLGEARGHNPIPSVKNILDLRVPSLMKIVSEDLDDLIQQSLKDIKSHEFSLSIYFGQNVAKKYHDLSLAFHRHFQVPYFRIKFIHHEKWIVQSVRTISENEIPQEHFPYVEEFARAYFSKKRYDKARQVNYDYSLAILVKEGEEAQPSGAKAIQKFIDAADELGIEAEVIGPKDMNRLPAFDGLFIRQTTDVNNEAYRFARKAQSEGLALIDYPDAILKCCNKVYVAELLHIAGISTPRTMIVHKDNRNKIIETIGLPCVLKLPDSSFSMGVKKASTEKELNEILDSMLKKSELIIVQEYCYTDYDWRIGVLDGKALFACRYFMAKGHWQIYNWKADKQKEQEGGWDGVPIKKVPKGVVDIALKSAKLIGDGIYGIDIKEVNGEPVVVEINDNPNLDNGVEDLIIGDKLYLEIMKAFRRRMDK